MIFLTLLNWIAALLPHFEITNFDGTPYLLRAKLRGRLPGEPEKGKSSAYLHRFKSHDYDRELHNHPWTWSFSIVLLGGYIEQRRHRDGSVTERRVRPLSINWLGQKDFHRFLKLEGRQTWTLFIAGRKANAWGFLVDGYFISHARYVAMKKKRTFTGIEDPLPSWMLTCGLCTESFPPPSASVFAHLTLCPNCTGRLERAHREKALA